MHNLMLTGLSELKKSGPTFTPQQGQRLKVTHRTITSKFLLLKVVLRLIQSLDGLSVSQ